MSTAVSAGASMSRRAFLRGGRARSAGGVAGAAGALLGFTSALSHALSAPPEQAFDLDPRALLHKLVRRCTFGPNASEMARARTLGFQGYVDYQLKPGSDGMGGKLGGLSLLKKSAASIYAIDKKNFDEHWEARRQLQRAAILRAVYSKKQLVERLVEFWGDHFNITSEGDLRILKLVDDREVIRKHALGTFPRMLLASAQSPAMMRYLDNDQSTGENPNENYAREVMELHTLGVTGGYTQSDIANVAKCLSGWGLYYSWDKDNARLRGSFRFNPNRHNTTDKTVLGHFIPGRIGPSGIEEGLTVMRILAEHPSTARFIATKLCRRFLEDTPRTAWVEEVALVYTQTGGDIPSMMRAMLTPEKIMIARARLKRPFHLVASALRALDIKIPSGDERLLWELDKAGHEPFQWHPPNGFPDAPAYWANNPLPRWNFAAALASGHLKNLSVDAPKFFEGLVLSQDMLDRIDARLFQGTLPPDEKAVIKRFLSVAHGDEGRQADTLGLALSTPSFQWY